MAFKSRTVKYTQVDGAANPLCDSRITKRGINKMVAHYLQRVRGKEIFIHYIHEYDEGH